MDGKKMFISFPFEINFFDDLRLFISTTKQDDDDNGSPARSG
jgi:hypothetical protein